MSTRGKRRSKLDTGKTTTIAVTLLLGMWASVASAALEDCTAPPTPPIPGLEVVQVTDREFPGGLEQNDIDEALAICAGGASNGCNLEFLAGTYNNVHMDIGAFPDGFAMFGQGRGVTILKSRVFGLGEPYDHTIEVTKSAPDGVIIQGMTLDGMKNFQPVKLGNCLHNPAMACLYPYQCYNRTGGPMSNSCEEIPEELQRCENGSLPAATGIYTGTSDITKIRSGGVIHDVEVRNYLQAGISLREVDDWTLKCNDVHDIGCHSVTQSCGAAWDAQPDITSCVSGKISSLKDRKTDGKGLGLGQNSIDCRIEDNLVEDATKACIFTYTNGQGCDGVPSIDGTIISRNTTRGCGSGIHLNGGCNAVVEDNLAEHMTAPGTEDSNLGKGFICGDGGQGTVWRNNIARFNQAEGFSIGCKEGDLLLEDNVSHDNCQTTTWPLADTTLKPVEGESVDLVVIRNHTAWNSENCWAGMLISNRSNVRVDGGSIEGGSSWGILAKNGSGIVIEDIWVEDGQWGMAFGPGLETTYVQDSAVFTGFDTEVCMEDGGACDSPNSVYVPNNGDDIAFCRLENPAVPQAYWPDPQCCKNFPLQDLNCPPLP